MVGLLSARDGRVPSATNLEEAEPATAKSYLQALLTTSAAGSSKDHSGEAGAENFEKALGEKKKTKKKTKKKHSSTLESQIATSSSSPSSHSAEWPVLETRRAAAENKRELWFGTFPAVLGSIDDNTIDKILSSNSQHVNNNLQPLARTLGQETPDGSGLDVDVLGKVFYWGQIRCTDSIGVSREDTIKILHQFPVCSSIEDCKENIESARQECECEGLKKELHDREQAVADRERKVADREREVADRENLHKMVLIRQLFSDSRKSTSMMRELQDLVCKKDSTFRKIFRKVSYSNAVRLISFQISNRGGSKAKWPPNLHFPVMTARSAEWWEKNYVPGVGEARLEILRDAATKWDPGVEIFLLCKFVAEANASLHPDIEREREDIIKMADNKEFVYEGVDLGPTLKWLLQVLMQGDSKSCGE